MFGKLRGAVSRTRGKRNVAHLGDEKAQFYYDEEKKCWILPGQNVEEVGTRPRSPPKVFTQNAPNQPIQNGMLVPTISKGRLKYAPTPGLSVASTPGSSPQSSDLLPPIAGTSFKQGSFKQEGGKPVFFVPSRQVSDSGATTSSMAATSGAPEVEVNGEVLECVTDVTEECCCEPHPEPNTDVDSHIPCVLEGGIAVSLGSSLVGIDSPSKSHDDIAAGAVPPVFSPTAEPAWGQGAAGSPVAQVAPAVAGFPSLPGVVADSPVLAVHDLTTPGGQQHSETTPSEAPGLDPVLAASNSTSDRGSQEVLDPVPIAREKCVFTDDRKASTTDSPTSLASNSSWSSAQDPVKAVVAVKSSGCVGALTGHDTNGRRVLTCAEFSQYASETGLAMNYLQYLASIHDQAGRLVAWQQTVASALSVKVRLPDPLSEMESVWKVGDRTMGEATSDTPGPPDNYPLPATFKSEAPVDFLTPVPDSIVNGEGPLLTTCVTAESQEESCPEGQGGVTTVDLTTDTWCPADDGQLDGSSGTDRSALYVGGSGSEEVEGDGLHPGEVADVLHEEIQQELPPISSPEDGQFVNDLEVVDAPCQASGPGMALEEPSAPEAVSLIEAFRQYQAESQEETLGGSSCQEAAAAPEEEAPLLVEQAEVTQEAPWDNRMWEMLKERWAPIVVAMGDPNVQGYFDYGAQCLDYVLPAVVPHVLQKVPILGFGGVDRTPGDQELLAELQAKVKELSISREENAAMQDKVTLLHEALKDAVKGHDAQLLRVTEELCMLRSQLSGMQSEAEQAKRELEEKDQMLAVVRKEAQNKDDQLAVVKSELEEKDQELAVVRKEAQDKDDQLAVVKRAMQEKTKELIHVREENTEYRTHYVKAKKKVEVLKAQLKESQKKCAEYQEVDDELYKNLVKMDESLKKVQAELATVKGEKEALHAELKDHEASIEQKDELLAAVTLAANEARLQVAKHEDTIASLSDEARRSQEALAGILTDMVGLNYLVEELKAPAKQVVVVVEALAGAGADLLAEKEMMASVLDQVEASLLQEQATSRAALAKAEQSAEKVKKQYQKARKLLAEKEAGVAEKTAAVEDLSCKLEATSRELDAVKCELQLAQQMLDERETETNNTEGMLEQQVADMEVLREENHALKEAAGEVEHLRNRILVLEAEVREREELKERNLVLEEEARGSVALKEKIEALEAEVRDTEALKELLHGLEGELSELQRLREANHVLEEELSAVQALKDKLLGVQGELNVSRERNRALEEEVASLATFRQQVEHLECELSALKSAFKDVQSDRDQLAAHCGMIQAQLAVAEEEMRCAKKALEEQEEKFMDLQKRFQKGSKQFTRIKKQCDAAEARVKELEQNLAGSCQAALVNSPISTYEAASPCGSNRASLGGIGDDCVGGGGVQLPAASPCFSSPEANGPGLDSRLSLEVDRELEALLVEVENDTNQAVISQPVENGETLAVGAHALSPREVNHHLMKLLKLEVQLRADLSEAQGVASKYQSLWENAARELDELRPLVAECDELSSRYQAAKEELRHFLQESERQACELACASPPVVLQVTVVEGSADTAGCDMVGLVSDYETLSAKYQASQGDFLALKKRYEECSSAARKWKKMCLEHKQRLSELEALPAQPEPPVVVQLTVRDVVELRVEVTGEPSAPPASMEGLSSLEPQGRRVEEEKLSFLEDAARDAQERISFLEQKCQSADQDLSCLTVQYQNAQQEISHLQNQCRSAQGLVSHLEVQCRDVGEENVRLVQVCEDAEEKVSCLERQCQDAEQEIIRLNGQCRDTQEQVSDLKVKCEAAEEEISRLTEAVSTAEEEVADLRMRLEDESSRGETLSEEVKRLRCERATLTSAVEELQEKHALLAADKLAAEQQSQAMAQDQSKLAVEVQALRTQLVAAADCLRKDEGASREEVDTLTKTIHGLEEELRKQGDWLEVKGKEARAAVEAQEKLAESLAAEEERCGTLKAEVDDWRVRCQMMEARVGDAQTAIDLALQAQQSSFDQIRCDLEKEVALLEGELGLARERLRLVEEGSSRQLQAMSTFTREMEDMQSTIESLSGANREMKERVEQLKRVATEVREANSALVADKIDLEQQVAEAKGWKERANELMETVSALTSSKEEFKGRLVEMEDWKEEAEKLKEASSSLVSENANLERRLAEMDQLREEAEELRGAHSLLLSQKADLEGRLAKMEDLRKEAEVQSRDALSFGRAQVEELRMEVGALQEASNGLMLQKDKLEVKVAEMDSLTLRAQQLEAVVHGLTCEKLALQEQVQEIDVLRYEAEQLRQVLSAVTADKGELEMQLTELISLRCELDGLKGIVSVLKEEKAALEEKLGRVELKEQELENMVKTLTHAKHVLEGQVTAMEEMCGKLEDDRRVTAEELEQKNDELNQLRSMIRQLAEQERVLNAQLADLQQQQQYHTGSQSSEATQSGLNDSGDQHSKATGASSGDLEATVEQLMTEVSSRDTHIQDLSQRLSLMEGQLHETEVQAAQIRGAMAETLRKEEELRGTLDLWRDRYEQLERQHQPPLQHQPAVQPPSTSLGPASPYPPPSPMSSYQSAYAPITPPASVELTPESPLVKRPGYLKDIEQQLQSSRMEAEQAKSTVATLQRNMYQLQVQIGQLEAQLMAERQRVAEVASVYLQASSTGASSSAVTSKKLEDIMGYDLEGALMSGGADAAAGTFQPLAGFLRGRYSAVCNNKVAVSAAQAVDRGTLSLYNRPMARLMSALYVLSLHVLFLKCMMSGCGAS